MPVKVRCDGQESITLFSADVSDSGVFLKTDEPAQLPIGTLVELQVQMAPDAEAAPVIKGKVVRETAEGIGIRFILED